MRKWLINLALLSVVVGAGLLATEWAVRVSIPQTLVRAYNVPDPELGTYVAANADVMDSFSADGPYRVRTNSRRFRMDEEVDLAASRRRVLVYGDSYTFGWGLDIQATYFTALKRAMEARDPRLQLINAGVGGYSTGHVKKLMERHLPTIKPWAIVYFFNNNDLIDNANVDIDYRVTRFVVGNDGDVTLTDVRPFAPWKRFLLNHTPYGWLNRHSHLFVAAKGLLKRALRWKRGLTVPELGTTEGVDATPVNRVTAVPGMAAPQTVGPSLRLRRFVAISKAHVARIVAMAEAAAVPLLVVWVPAPDEMFPPVRVTAAMQLFELGRRMLRDMGDAAPAMTFADLSAHIPHTPDWRRRQGTLRLSDGHFNAEGSAWYAALAAPALAEFLLRP